MFESACEYMAPLGGVERPRRVVRFARLMHRRVRVLGGPAARAAYGGKFKPGPLAAQGGLLAPPFAGLLLG